MNRNRLHLIPVLLAVAATLGAPSLQGQVPQGLRRAEPITCASNNDLVVRGRFIETEGNGIVVEGNCEIVVADSHIVAGGVAVLVQGNGEAMLSNSYVEGRQAALVAAGNGEIRYNDTTLRGATRTGGQGAIVGDDGASHGSGGAAGIPGQVRIGLGGIQVQEGNDTVSIGAGGIVADDGTDTVSVRPGPEGVRIETDDGTVILDAGVTVDGGLLRLGTSIEVSGDWRIAGHSSYLTSDTDRLLLELGANDEGGQLRLGLGGDVLFDLDSVAIRPPGATELRKLAHVLRQRAAGEIRLVGHTDSLGSADHNLKLSQARAVSVMRWLNNEEGVPAQLMVGEGLGAQQPVAHNTLPDGSDNPAGRAQNRRVEIFFTTRH